MLGIIVGLLFTVPAAAAVFEDSEGHWAESAIDTWHHYGVIAGDDRGFRPDDEVTRAEFSVMLNNIMRYVERKGGAFSDLYPSQWYYDPMVRLHAAGVLSGINGKAVPNQAITRQEAAVLIANALHLQNDGYAASFEDNEDIAPWALDKVNALVSRNVIHGLPDGTFQPLRPLTRAQAVTIFDQAVKQLIGESGEFSGDVDGNVIVQTRDVTLKDMTIAGNLYIAPGVGDGDVSLDNVNVEGSVFVLGGGENTILFNNVNVKGALVVNKYDGKVRVLATGNTTVSVTVLDSGAVLVARELTGGGFETVEISPEVASGHQIVLEGNFEQVVNYSDKAQITAEGTIKELVAEVNTNIKGQVNIEKISATSGVETVINDQAANEEYVFEDNDGSIPAGRGNAGNGNNDEDEEEDDDSEDDGNDEGSTIAVTSVSIDADHLSLIVGETKQLTAAVAPENATNPTVVWTVQDGSNDVIQVDENGKVTAISPGTKVVEVTTVDGGKTDQVSVTVLDPALTFEVLMLTEDDATSDIDAQVILNSSNARVLSVTPSVYKEYDVQDVLVLGLEEMLETDVPKGAYLSLIITAKDQTGRPVADVSGIKATVLNDTYAHVSAFGAGLKDKDSSLIFSFDARQPERIQNHQIVFSHDKFADSTFNVTYIPKGAPYMKAVEPIQGDTQIGSVLTAGKPIYEGEPVDDQLTYQWLRAAEEDGLYEIIVGANDGHYVLTEEDSGKYIRVVVRADQIHAGGSAVSAPFGKIDQPIEETDIFQAIEAVYLNKNSDRNNVVSDLNLITSLKQFPGVTITWTSSNEEVITNEGKVLRDALNDQFVDLTVHLDGAVTGSRTYALIVRSESTDRVELEDYIDPYFAADYPQAYLKDGHIWVRFKLKQPAEVYMIVNAINGHWEADVNAVLQGHAGEDNHMIFVDAWPYFHVQDTDRLYDFDTGVSLKDDGPARVEFVIQDRSDDYLSDQVTSIVFDQETVDALDTAPPRMHAVYMNEAMNHIYVYFSEPLDLDSVPAAKDFALNVGNVDSVELYNYEHGGAVDSYVKLSVSGITNEHQDTLTLSYTGETIRDTADAKNKAETWLDEPVISIEDMIEEVTISSDRKYMIVEIVPGWNPNDNDYIEAAERFTIQVDGAGSYHPQSGRYSYNTEHLTYRLIFDTPLPEGNVTVSMDTTGMTNWAMDPFAEKLSAAEVDEISAPGTPEAVYEQNRNMLKISFAEGFRFVRRTFNAAGLTLSVDGTDYKLRGYIAMRDYEADHQLRILLDGSYIGHIREALANGNQISIQYKKLYGENSDQIADAAGALLPDFDSVPVKIVP